MSMATCHASHLMNWKKPGSLDIILFKVDSSSSRNAEIASLLTAGDCESSSPSTCSVEIYGYGDKKNSFQDATFEILVFELFQLTFELVAILNSLIKCCDLDCTNN